MTAQKDTRTLILDAAQALVQRQSYSGVSFQSLAKAIGIKKGSMYYHFESKEELVVAILERAASELKEWFREGEGRPVGERLQRFFKVYHSVMKPGEKLCPAGAFVGEWETLSAPIRKAVNKVFTVQTKAMTAILHDGEKSGELNLAGEPAEPLAEWAVSSLQGALLVSRASGKRATFAHTEHMIRRAIGLETALPNE